MEMQEAGEEFLADSVDVGVDGSGAEDGNDPSAIERRKAAEMALEVWNKYVRCRFVVARY